MLALICSLEVHFLFVEYQLIFTKFLAQFYAILTSKKMSSVLNLANLNRQRACSVVPFCTQLVHHCTQSCYLAVKVMNLQILYIVMLTIRQPSKQFIQIQSKAAWQVTTKSTCPPCVDRVSLSLTQLHAPQNKKWNRFHN